MLALFLARQPSVWWKLTILEDNLRNENVRKNEDDLMNQNDPKYETAWKSKPIPEKKKI